MHKKLKRVYYYCTRTRTDDNVGGGARISRVHRALPRVHAHDARESWHMTQNPLNSRQSHVRMNTDETAMPAYSPNAPEIDAYENGSSSTQQRSVLQIGNPNSVNYRFLRSHRANTDMNHRVYDSELTQSEMIYFNYNRNQLSGGQMRRHSYDNVRTARFRNQFENVQQFERARSQSDLHPMATKQPPNMLLYDDYGRNESLNMYRSHSGQRIGTGWRSNSSVVSKGNVVLNDATQTQNLSSQNSNNFDSTLMEQVPNSDNIYFIDKERAISRQAQRRNGIIDMNRASRVAQMNSYPYNDETMI